MARIQSLVLAGRDSLLLEAACERLSALPGCLITRAADEAALRAALRQGQADAAWLALGGDFAANIRLVRALSPTSRVIAYGRDPSLADLREALRLGAGDLLSLEGDGEAAFLAALRGEAADPALSLLIRPEELTGACQRALLLRRRLESESGSLFFLNANRSAFILLQVVPLRPEADVCLRAIEVQWLQQLGAHSAMIFPAERYQPSLLLGASIEMSYADQRGAEKSVREQLARFFQTLEPLHCAAIATSCGADLLNLSVFRRMTALCDLAFYAREQAYYPYNFSAGACVVPESVYHQYCQQVTAGQIDQALAGVRALAARFRQDLPAPAQAREKLLRFLWVHAALRQKDLLRAAALELDLSHIDRLVDSLCRVIAKAEALPLSAPEAATPLDQLIAGIDRNPGAALSIDDAAERVGFSRSHFCRVFRQRTGQSFTAYQTGRRMDMAAQLLRGTQLSVAQISRLAGIDNTWYFRKVFAHRQGQTPESCREAALLQPAAGAD